MSIDGLLHREYDRGAYNCLHFAADAWELLTGDTRLRQVREDDFKAGRLAALFRDYKRVAGPTVTPAIVLMETLEGDAHIGVCVRRRLLHNRDWGPSFFSVEAMSAFYRNMRYYA